MVLEITVAVAKDIKHDNNKQNVPIRNVTDINKKNNSGLYDCVEYPWSM